MHRAEIFSRCGLLWQKWNQRANSQPALKLYPVVVAAVFPPVSSRGNTKPPDSAKFPPGPVAPPPARGDRELLATPDSNKARWPQLRPARCRGEDQWTMIRANDFENARPGLGKPSRLETRLGPKTLG